MNETTLLAPIRSSSELSPITKLDERDDTPISENQARWKQRTDEAFVRCCMTRFGREWLVHIPSLLKFLEGRRAA